MITERDGDDDRDRVADYQKMVAVLREAKIRAELYLGNPKNMGNQLKYADRRNSPCVIIQGSDEKARGEFLEAAFADAIAVYLLSLTLDVDYYELREREYPLLAPRQLGERLRKVADLFPPNPGYEFAIRYRRRG